MQRQIQRDHYIKEIALKNSENTKHCTNYFLILVINVDCKILTKIMTNRLEFIMQVFFTITKRDSLEIDYNVQQ